MPLSDGVLVIQIFLYYWSIAFIYLSIFLLLDLCKLISFYQCELKSKSFQYV